jgi:PAS domain-containing protein
MLKEKEETNSFDESVAFGIPRDAANKLRTFIKTYLKKRIELKLKQRLLYDENAKRRIEYLNKLPYTEALYFPQTINSPATTTIYGNKVMFWIWSEPILSILIESERMADAYRRYFEILYSFSKRELAKGETKSDDLANLKTLISTTPFVFYALKINEDFDFLFISENVNNILGYTSDEILNSNCFWKEHVYPEDLENFFKELHNLNENKNLDLRIKTKNEKYVSFKNNIMLIKDKEDRPFLILGFLKENFH